MEIILAVVCVLCLCLGFACIRYRAELKSLYRQLEEVAAGSHIELTRNSRCKPLLALCRMLNHVLQARDRDYQGTMNLLVGRDTGGDHES